MRLENQKPSKNLKDISWIPEPELLFNVLLGRKNHYKQLEGYQRADDSYITSPNGDLSPDEIQMVRSGASYKDILYMRSLRDFNRRMYTEEWNPYIQGPPPTRPKR